MTAQFCRTRHPCWPLLDRAVITMRIEIEIPWLVETHTCRPEECRPRPFMIRMQSLHQSVLTALTFIVLSEFHYRNKLLLTTVVDYMAITFALILHKRINIVTTIANNGKMANRRCDRCRKDRMSNRLQLGDHETIRCLITAARASIRHADS